MDIVIFFSYKCEEYIYHCYQLNTLFQKVVRFLYRWELLWKRNLPYVGEIEYTKFFFFEKVFNVHIEFPWLGAVFSFGTEISGNYFWLK